MLKKNLEDLWGSIPIPLANVNSVFKVLEVGKSFKAKFGYNEEEITGECLEIVFCKKEDFEKVKNKILKDNELRACEALLKTKEGGRILSSIYAKPKKSGKGEITGYLFSFLDISEKKRVEDELQKKIKDLEQSANELKSSRAALLNILEDIEEARGLAETEKDKTMAIIENFPEGLLFFNRTNQLFSMNQKIGEFFNFSIKAEEIMGKTPEELLALKNFSPVMEILINRENKETTRKEIEVKKGLVLEVSFITVRKKENKIGTLVILRNVTR